MEASARKTKVGLITRKRFLTVTGVTALGTAAASGGCVSSKSGATRLGKSCVSSGKDARLRLFRRLDGAAAKLFEYGQDVPTIDTHEHIPSSEQEYNQLPIQFGHLLNPYIAYDLVSAGMKLPPGAPVGFHCIDDNWDAFEPYWNHVKFGSYARALRIALQHFYGVDDLTRENHKEVVRRIAANNTPGIYARVLRDECRIERIVLNGGGYPAPLDSLMALNPMSPSMLVMNKDAASGVVREAGGGEAKTLAEFIEASDKWMALQVSRGAVAFKTGAAPVETPDQTQAGNTYSKIMAGEMVDGRQVLNLGAAVREANARKAGDLDVPLCFHTGVWGDFRTVQATDLIGLIMRNPGTRIDIYHLGIPDARSTIQIVKNFPNAYLNLCWAHIVASDMTVQTLKEAMDMLPMNKIFAFGADYKVVIEKVYGHLQIARENVAVVLGDRVDRNLMGLEDAKETYRAWFYDNPKRFYRL